MVMMMMMMMMIVVMVMWCDSDDGDDGDDSGDGDDGDGDGWYDVMVVVMVVVVVMMIIILLMIVRSLHKYIEKWANAVKLISQWNKSPTGLLTVEQKLGIGALNTVKDNYRWNKC